LIALASFKLGLSPWGIFFLRPLKQSWFRLKRFLYEKTDTAYEIVQLGWQKQGFWAWCDGIFHINFTKVDANGIVKHDNLNY